MILPNHKIKLWFQSINRCHKKMNFIRFLCNVWKKIYSRSKFDGTKMSLAYDEECFKVTTGNVKEVSYLRCSHEEADIQIFFRDKDASQSKDAIVEICEDTDVFSIAISKADIIGVSIYMKEALKTEHGSLILLTFPSILEVIFSKAFQECMPSLGVTRTRHLEGKEKLLA